MIKRYSAFSKLVMTLLLVLMVASLIFFALGIQGVRQANHQSQLEIRGHGLVLAAAQIRTAIFRKEYDRALELIRQIDERREDRNTDYYLRSLARALSMSAPDYRHARSLAEGWHVYQLHEVFRATDELRVGFRWVILQGWISWIGLILLSLFIIRQIVRSLARPLNYLDEYARSMNLSKEIRPLFASESDRRRSGIDGAAREVQILVQKIEELLGQAREFHALNLNQMVEQKARAETLASVSRDGVFFLRGEAVLWSNAVGSSLMEMNPGRTDTHQSIESAIRTCRERVAPLEWRVLDAQGEAIRYYLLSYIARELDREAGPNDFDGVVIAQDVSWIRESESAKASFIGLLSHEVKTPVTSLLMATRLLQRSMVEGLTAVQRKLIDSSVKDVERLRELIDEFFSASSFNLNADQLQFRLVDLRRVLSQAIRSVRPEADSRSVNLDFTFACQSPDVLTLADAPRISWALSQVVTQGVRHAPKSSRIEIQMKDMADAPHSGFEIAIRSPGVFTSEEVRRRIFEKSFSHYDLRVARSDVTGMGLAIAREIAMGHGGSLALNLDYQDGTEFLFKLPRRRAEETVFMTRERN